MPKDLTPQEPIIPATEKVLYEENPFGASIGGLRANATSIYQGFGDNIFKASERGIHLGAADFSDAPFSVSMEGALVATTGTFSGNITGATITGSVISGTTVTGSTITGAKYQTKSSDEEGIKIIADAPDTVVGDTGVYLPTANTEPASPHNGAMWTNPANAQVINGSDATAVDVQKFTIWDSFTGLDTAIPSGVTIVGITVRCFASVNTVASIPEPRLRIQLTKSGSDFGSNKTTNVLTTTDSLVTAGGADDLWGTTWTVSDIGNLGAEVTQTGVSSGTTYNLDYIQVIVHYERVFTDDLGDTIADSFIQFWNTLGNTLVYLKKNTLDILIDKANLIIKGTLTVEPQEIIVANTGVKFPSANGASDASANGWTNPDNAEADDGVFTTADQTSVQRFFVWKAFKLQGSIPAGAIVKGVVVDVQVKVDTGTSTLAVQLVQNGETGVGDVKTSATITTSDTDVSLGGSADLWGLTQTAEDFGSDFGVEIAGSDVGTHTYSIDFIKITVHYTTTGDNSIDGNILPTVDDVYDIGSDSFRYGRIRARKLEAQELVVDELTKISIITADKTITGAGSDSDTEIFSVLIKGGTLGTNSGVKVKMFFDNMDTTVNTHTIGFKFKYGSTTVITGSTLTPDINAMKGTIEFLLLGNAATNAQEMSMQTIFYLERIDNTAVATVQGIRENKVGTAAEDSTKDLNLVVTSIFSNTANTITISHVIIEKIQ